MLLICAFTITVLLYHVSKNSSQWDYTQELLYKKTGPHTHLRPGHPPPPAPPPPPPKPDPNEQYNRPAHKPPPPVHHGNYDQPDVDRDLPIKIPELKTGDGVWGSYSLPTKVPVSHDTHREDGVADAKPKPTKTVANVPYRDEGVGVVRLGEQSSSAPTSTTVHWQKPSEWFPVPEESLILLPTGKPKPIPSVQFAFGKESAEAKEKRERRLAQVKAEAQRAWSGYKTYAWTHDELTPVSKMSKDPFCGWAATLVDSLDTLWIMGLKDEFDDAVEAVKKLDFTTSPYRSDIPVFETVIRYLGGLVAAYDVTGGHDGKYPALLEKAVELAEILMSAFDTPNRMPILYYNWKPEYNRNPKRASKDVSVAELGSLSMEFTRLAQLTGKHKYYDAVARITDAFEDLQNRENATAIPGIFPEHLDASGCNHTAPAAPTVDNSSDASQKRASDETNPGGAVHGYDPSSSMTGQHEAAGSRREDDIGSELKFGLDVGAENETGDNATFHAGLRKRDGPPVTVPKTFATSRELPPNWDCVPQGLTGGGWGMGSYSMGGSQDSTYEYFPKQYLLLGGLEAKYRTMHEKVADAVKQYLLYRPMAKGDPDILFSAKAYSPDGTADKLSYDWEATHLTCFIGGMFGLGGKIFDRPEDVDVAKKLADGCVWAYEVMPAGIMPETATLMPCKKPDDCHWNQTAWYERLDPNWDSRDSQMEDYYVRKAEWKKQVEEIRQKEALRKQTEERKRREEAERKAAGVEDQDKRAAHNPGTGSSDERTSSNRPISQAHNPTYGSEEGRGQSRSEFRKRDSPSDSDSRDTASGSSEENIRKLQQNLGFNPSDASERATSRDDSDQKPISNLWVPPEPVKPLTHLEYVQQRLEKEHIPPGFVMLNDKRYILR